MSEEEKSKEDNQSTPVNTEEGVHTKTLSALDRADSIAERQKRENDRREAILTREEALEARRQVGGVTEAGQAREVTPEQTNKEYALEAISGKLNGS
jgi:hypothetical protein|tara:strand:- start:872 stop:1162 length:291 start_codon:yes stop_codon:yes gene_type:complete